MARNTTTALRAAMLATCASLALGGAAMAQGKPVRFDIPAEDLGAALNQLAQQGQREIVFNADLTRGKQSPALRGEFTAQAALDRLLIGTGLQARTTSDGQIVVEKTGPQRVGALDGPGDSAVSLGEVVVTAQRRAERLQDVPVAISAFSQAALDRQHVAGVRDLARVTPSLSFTEPSPGQTVISLRGLTTESSLSPVVGFYLDETPFELRSDIYAGMPAIELFDVQRVEVLRGPQGTLFGAGAMGGAIRIITNRPDASHTEGQAEQEVSFTDGGKPSYVLRGAYNQPLAENLALRVVGAYRHSGGFIDGALPTNYYTLPTTPVVAAKDENSADIYSVRAALRWEASPTLAITPSAIYQRIDATGLNYYDSVTTNHVNYRIYPGDFTDKLFIANLLVQKDLGFADLTSSTSWMDKRGSALTDYSSTGANLAAAFTGETTTQPLYPTDNSRPASYRQLTQEIRATSKSQGWLRWTVGAYYNYTSEETAQLVTSPALGAIISNIFGVSPASPTLIDFTGWNSDNQIAGFGEATIVPFAGLEITGGLRAYRLKQAVYQDVEGLLGDGPTPVERSDAKGINPKFVISYKPTRELTAYATAAKGFRAGGPNGVLIGAGCTLTDVYRNTYEPDGVWNYEAGLKTQFLNGRATANIAAYRIDWDNIQGEVSSNCGSFEANFGTARINGVEAEVGLMPVDGLTLTGAFSFNDAKLRSLKPGFTSGVAAQPGDRIVNVPRYQWSFSGEYAPHTDWAFQPYVGVNFQHVGGTPTNYTFTTPELFRPGYDNLDVNLGVRSGRIDASIFARNLTNETQIVDIVHTSLGRSLYNPGRPLTVGVNLKERF